MLPYQTEVVKDVARLLAPPDAPSKPGTLSHDVRNYCMTILAESVRSVPVKVELRL